MGAARFVASKRAQGDHFCEDEHVAQFPDEIQSLVGPLGAVLQVDVSEALAQLVNFDKSFLQRGVVTNHRDVFGHDVAEFTPNRERIETCGASR